MVKTIRQNKKIAFGDNLKVRFSVVRPFLKGWESLSFRIRKVFYTFLHHKKLNFLKILLFLFAITSYELLATSYELFAQDKIIAIVNKDIITQKDLNDFINFMRVQLAAEYKGEQLETKIQSMKLDLLDKLIEDSLILQEAKRGNIKINPDRIKVRVSEIIKHYGSDSEFQNSLTKQGLVKADIEAKIREQLLMYSVIDMEIRSKIIIKPGEVTDFYQENTEKFILPEQREFESITIDNESLANEIFDQLKSGQELQDVADRYSLTVNKFSCVRNGQLRKDIEDTVFKINLAQISRPIKIDTSASLSVNGERSRTIENNYYIFKLNNIIPPRHQNLSEVQDKIYSMLFNKKMQEALTKWLDELRKRSYIKIIQN
jgi:parvulin-like peptidyl-prolyl isomerase